MENDYPDPEGHNRSTYFLQTKNFGKVFTRIGGNKKGELILMIHGSGPENSSIWWN
jgi:hypothetical protein